MEAVANESSIYHRLLEAKAVPASDPVPCMEFLYRPMIAYARRLLEELEDEGSPYQENAAVVAYFVLQEVLPFLRERTWITLHGPDGEEEIRLREEYGIPLPPDDPSYRRE